MIGELTALAIACAPNVHPNTLDALVMHESGRKPYAINVNGDMSGISGLARQPVSRDEAITQARTLMTKGVDFDAGLGQINVRNWHWLKLTAETVFDPCTNLQAAQTILTQCYTRALKRHQAEQQALQAALSCYNTGNFERGFRNGYVDKVLAQAGIKIPAIRAAPRSDSTSSVNLNLIELNTAGTLAPTTESTSERETRGDRDGFVNNPAPDGFSRLKKPQTPALPS